jgi:hypothetical protein
MRTLAIGFGLVLTAASASAQTTPESRWTPWLGCWDLVIENSRDGSPADELPRPQRGSSTRGDLRPRVCVEPADGGGATFRTTIGDRTPIVQTVVADGTARPISETDCTGTQRAEWSRDGLRIFSRAELTCKGDAGPRRVSGIGILGANSTWIDVQSIVVDGRDTYRVRRYRRASSDPNASRQAGRRLTLDDVKEASAKVTPHALEAALVEMNASFGLSSRRLIELDEAHVPAQVIDLMVALSYPQRFVVERTARADVGPGPILDDPFGLGWAFGYPVWSDGFGLYSPLYGPYSSYYYSPFSYRYLPGYNPYFTGGGGLVFDGGGLGSPDPRPSGAGRVVDGLGYTRVRPRESEPTSASTQGFGSPGVSGSSAGSSGSSGSSSGGSSSGGSTVSSQGFSNGGGGGGGGGDTGRTAQPR